MSRHYNKIAVATAIIGGDGDKIASFERQSVGLHQLLQGSKLVRAEGAGHMVHYSHTDEIIEAIHWVARQNGVIPAIAAGDELMPGVTSKSF
jgi:pimeloyl-ACP methyl ester carboxylesterase